MNKCLVALALAGAFAPAAFAQNTTIYGVVDLAVERLSKAAPAGGALHRMPALTGTVPSRLGFRGAEDLGAGLKAVYTLEMGLGADTGNLNQGGRGWGRQAHVGLQGAWGTLSFGRQYTMMFWGSLDYDLMGPSAYSSASLDNYFPNARYDNAIAYRGSFSGFTLGAVYSLGRDAVNAGPSPAGTNCGGESAADKQACKGTSLMLKYDTPTWGVAVVNDSFHGGPGAFAGLTNSGLTDERTLFNGYFKVGGVKVGAGLMTRTNEGSAATPKSTLILLGASYAVSPQLTLDGGLYQLKFKNSANEALLFTARATYALSKRSAVYATVGQIDNSGSLALSVSGAQAGGAPVAGGSQTGLAAGIRHAF